MLYLMSYVFCVFVRRHDSFFWWLFCATNTLFASAIDAGCLLRLCRTPCFFFLMWLFAPSTFCIFLGCRYSFKKKSQIQTYVKCHNRKIWTIMFASIQECICDLYFFSCDLFIALSKCMSSHTSIASCIIKLTLSIYTIFFSLVRFFLTV